MNQVENNKSQSPFIASKVNEEKSIGKEILSVVYYVQGWFLPPRIRLENFIYASATKRRKSATKKQKDKFLHKFHFVYRVERLNWVFFHVP